MNGSSRDVHPTGAAPLGTPAGTATLRFASALVGRRGELEHARSFLSRTRANDGGILLITGEAGIGKTRLALEAAHAADHDGMTVLSVSCQDQDRGVPYAPWVALVREYVERQPKPVVHRTAGPFLNALVRLAPELAEKFWMFDPGARAPVEWERRLFLAAIANFFVAAAAERPLLLSIDDLGWADAASLELLETVARVSRGKALGIVGTFRDTHLDDNAGLQALLLSVDREPWTATIVVPPFEVEELGTYVGSLLQRPEIPGGFRDLIYAKTRGNPFYATEILQGLVDEGQVYRTSEGWDWKPIEGLALPATVGGSIGVRLRRLDEQSLQVLRVASLFGQEFTFEILQAVTATPQDQVLLALEGAEKARLIKVRPARSEGAVFEFAHPLIQEVLEKEVSVVRARIVHLRAAQVLREKYGSEASAHAATLAFHYLRGNDAAHALEYSQLAGNQSAAVFARAEAAGHFRNALELLPENPDPRLSAELKERLADQLRGLADVPKAAGLYVEAAGLWEQLGNRSAAGECLRRAAACWLGPVDQGLELLERSRRLLEGEPPGRSLVRWHLLWGAAIFDLGRVEEADRESRKGLELARQIGDASGEASALLRLGYTVPLDRRDECATLNEQAGVIIEREHLVEQSGELLVSRAIVHYHLLGNLSDALAVVQEGVATARRVGDVEFERWWMGFGVAWASIRGGDFVLARQLVEERRRMYKHLSLSGWAPDVEAIGVRAWLATLTGPLEEAETLLDEAFVAERRRPVWRAEAHNYQFLGRLRRARGDLAAAVEAFERSREIYRMAGPPAWHVFLFAETLRLLVQTYLENGSPELARARTEELEELARRFRGEQVEAEAWRARALCDRGTEGGPAALALLERSREVFGRLGWKYDVGLTWEEIGDLHVSAGRTEAAQRAYEAAVTRYGELGAGPDRSRLERKIEAFSRQSATEAVRPAP